MNIFVSHSCSLFPWRGMGSARLFFAQDSPCDDNKQPYHTGSVAARVNKDRPSAAHKDGGVKYATGESWRIRGRDNITIGTWNTRTLRAAGKLQELKHEMDRYRWNILGLCEMRWKNLAKQQQRKDTRFSSVEKRINTSMALDFLFTRTS